VINIKVIIAFLSNDSTAVFLETAMISTPSAQHANANIEHRRRAEWHSFTMKDC
jgi:hypothetical protein